MPLLVLAGLAIIFFLVVHYRANTLQSENSTAQNFTVAEGDDIVVIGQRLAEEDLIANRFYFYYYVWQHKLRGKFHSGTYEMAAHSTIAEIVYKLTTSSEALIEKEKDVRITFPEGFTTMEMAQRLNENGLPGDDFLAMSRKPSNDLLQKYPFLSTDASLEGYLFPDTYFFAPTASAEDIVEKMLENFDDKIDRSVRERITQKDKSLHEMLIFASVIEGEVSSGDDRRIVAGIFKNRLDIGMPLQSDATIDYIKGVPEVKHSQEDVEIDSPYNTYKYPGLPPGPINNPSLSSIEAAIEPADTEYMYFLNNAITGETVFSRTFEEHVANKNENGL